MPLAKPNLLPGRLQNKFAHPYSVSSGEKGGQTPVHEAPTTGRSLWDCGGEAGPFPLSPGWRVGDRPLPAFLLP